MAEGKDFRNYDFLFLGVRLDLERNHRLQIEVGGSASKSVGDTSTNYLRMYYLGGSYTYRIPFWIAAEYGGGGVGYTHLEAQRLYQGRRGVATVVSDLAEFHAMLGVEYRPTPRSFLAIEARYSYATMLSPAR